MSLVELFPVLLAVHVTLAVTLFVPSLLLPFALRSARPGQRPAGAISRVLLWLHGTGSAVVAGGLALTGGAMLVVLGPQVLAQPWLLMALTIYVVNLALALLVQRPGLRRLLGMRVGAGAGDAELWRARARRQRYVSYLMAAAVGVIAFLMSTKPAL